VNRAQEDWVKRSNEANVNDTLFCGGEHQDRQWNPGDRRNWPQNFQRSKEGVDRAGTCNPNPNRDRQNSADAEAREDANQARTDVTRGVGRSNELDEGTCDRERPGNVPKVYQKVEFGLASQVPKANEESQCCSSMEQAEEGTGTPRDRFSGLAFVWRVFWAAIGRALIDVL
jgi:hypothetical protein